MNKIHITVLIEFFYPIIGGLQKQCLEVCARLTDKDCSFTVLTPKLTMSAPATEMIRGIQIRRFGPIGYSFWAKFLRGIKIFFHLLMEERRTQLLHIWGVSKLILPGIIASKLLKKPLLLQPGGADLLAQYSAFSGDRRPPWMLKIKNFFQTLAIRHISFFIALSKEIEDQFLSLGVQANQVVRLPNTVDRKLFLPTDPNRISALRKKLNLPDSLLLMVVGKLAQRKGLPLLLQTFQELKNKYADLKLILVGSGEGRLNSCEEELREIIRSNAIENEVIITGDIIDVHEFLQAADIFILPSEQEGMSLALLEAMSVGLPCISTSVGAAPELIRPGVDGQLIPPSDPSALTSAITLLLENPSLRKRMGHAASKRMDLFSFDAVLPRFMKLYRTLISK